MSLYPDAHSSRIAATDNVMEREQLADPLPPRPPSEYTASRESSKRGWPLFQSQSSVVTSSRGGRDPPQPRPNVGYRLQK